MRKPVSLPPLVLLLVAGAMTAACGHEQAGNDAAAAAVPSPPPASATSPTVATAAPDRTEVARRKAEEERRRAAAPPGVAITPSPAGTGIAEGSERFGTPIARRGDVTVYTPRRAKEVLTVPVKVVNSGRERAFYRFRIRVTGAGGFDATASASAEVVGLYPGTSWPTELTVRDSGRTPPASPRITIVSVERDVYRAG
ncbi:hypothetical protein [Streptomyces sp. NPDC020298]|uniref:hypothetical protein n=1 Tax=unclassified Streptomyces TaxID=2593676 RepID=UPI0033E2B0FA